MRTTCSPNLQTERSHLPARDAPLAGFPQPLRGSAEQREQVCLSSHGQHWEALDEDISIAGLIAGLGDQTAGGKTIP